jgi:ParB-like chromosome segregation protein Spo0J
MVIPPKTPIGRIETVALEDLKPNPRNARTHSKRQIKLIADSVKTFGFVNPILIDKDGMIIAGHGRLTAAKRLGMTEVPALRIEHLSEDEIRAYVLADNCHAAKAIDTQCDLRLRGGRLMIRRRILPERQSSRREAMSSM